jgi:prepilin-type N-terminal cleavage/methylation domain-containing protein
MLRSMKQKSGFTLIELSVVIAIIGIILYGSMSLLVVGIQTSQVNSTVATMDAIEKALLNFRVANGRIPCP